MQTFFPFFKFFIYLIFGLVLLAIVGNVWVIVSTKRFIYTNTSDLPVRKFAIVLGTAPLTKEGRPNAFFVSRVKAALELYRSCKIEKIIVSGFKNYQHYDEPGEMKKFLVSHGVNPEIIITDPAGVRTLDSIIRARDIHHALDSIIVSDPFHVSRALFIAQRSGMISVAYAPRSATKTPLWLEFREFLARITALLDLYILKTQPRSHRLSLHEAQRLE